MSGKSPTQKEGKSHAEKDRGMLDVTRALGVAASAFLGVCLSLPIACASSACQGCLGARAAGSRWSCNVEAKTRTAREKVDRSDEGQHEEPSTFQGSGGREGGRR